MTWQLAAPHPSCLASISLATRLAHGLLQTDDARAVRTAAWYAKPRPIFADTMAAVRREVWSSCYFAMSASGTETIKIPRWVFKQSADMVCYAA
jgi:hypothetical protein